MEKGPPAELCAGVSEGEGGEIEQSEAVKLKKKVREVPR